MGQILSDKNTIVFGDKSYSLLNKFLQKNNFSKAFILCDENTQEHCLPLFLQEISVPLALEVVEVESGEKNKEIETCQQLWSVLSELNGDRNSVMINLGGGIITDMGGFVASTFLRGIPFINIPTTLLSMVDASVGGKTGVNRAGIKNQIGLFKDAALTLIDVRYLSSLPQNQMKSGLAEMLKHGLIMDKKYWNKLTDLSRLNLTDLEDLIRHSIDLKTHITETDKTEMGLRKILNFGHTLGHAIESFCNKPENHKPEILHGEAVAVGMVLESYLSTKLSKLSEEGLMEITQTINSTFPKVEFNKQDISGILALLKFDKKNSNGTVLFVLLEQIGQAKPDFEVPEKIILEAFGFYNSSRSSTRNNIE